MSSALDPYRVLGLEPDASQAEVKRAYRRLAKALHPDAAGEAALPRFLELQDAYERLTGTKVRTVRAPAPPSGSGQRPGDPSGSGGAEGFREPWRADPARAQAAREQTRTRRASSGGQPGWSAESRGGASSGTRRSTTGPTRGASSGEPAGDGAAGGLRGQARGAGRRRASRKATLGSTSYDEAREPTDRSWAGASWYGPTTGEYWIVNPREYADPRKHGPGYTSRGRAGESDAGAPAPASGPVTSAGGARASGPDPSPGAEPAERPANTWAARAGTASTADPRAGSRSEVRTDPRPALGAMLRALGGSSADPWRRLGLVLLAWPPLGLAAATAIGQATGCLSYSATCDSTDRLLPWAAQAVLLALLVASPSFARILGAGTIAAVVALVPGVGIITALGGTSSAEGGPVLAGWLATAWLVGVGVGARRAIRGSRGGAPSAR